MLHCTTKDAEALARYLHGHFSNSGIQSIVAIARGGLIPGVYASHLFDLPLHVIDLKSYAKDNTRGDIIWNTLLPIDKIGNKVIVVDDICDTGATFQAMEAYLTEYGVESHFGAIVKKAHSTFDCEFVQLVDSNKWVNFEWEIE